jgi:SAM-dependent methyltransferase
MYSESNSEFEIDAFVDFYEALSDSFIDINRAVDSLKAQISLESKIFEIGLGTGYFAKHLHGEGYDICGIQPQDKMLRRLKNEHPDIQIKAEKSLEEYNFDTQWDVIVSHSSVFLFTRLESHFMTGEISSTLIFQSFLQDQEIIFQNIKKIMEALSEGGKFFINIQTNPKRRVDVGNNFSFEMLKCEYNFDRQVVSKLFRTIYNANTSFTEDIYFVLSFTDFRQVLGDMGFQVYVSADREWVILKKLAQED